MRKHFAKFRFNTKDEKKPANSRRFRCNLCYKVFRPTTAFHRFCKFCRQDDELFRFYEWLPMGV